MKTSRFPPLKKDTNGKNLCRGCGGPITEKRRKTWCSYACKLKFDPFYVKQAINRRDKGICQQCGGETKAIKSLVYLEVMAHAQRAQLLERARNLPRAEYDHIIPFSECGSSTLENMRTTCRPCHVAITAAWRKQKAKRRAKTHNEILPFRLSPDEGHQ